MAEEKKKQSINWQYLLQTRKNLAIAIGLGAMSVFLGVIMLIPNLQKVQAKMSEISQERAKLKSLTNKNETLQNVQATKLYEKKNQINVILPSLKPVLPLLNEIERISGENKVIVSEFGLIPGEISTASATPDPNNPPPQKALANPNLDSIETKLIIIGQIESINSFLKAINRITPLTETTELSLKAVNRQDLVEQQKLTQSNVFEATLTLKSHFFVGVVQVNPSQVIPDRAQYSDQDMVILDTYQIPVSSQLPVDFTIKGGGKDDLFSAGEGTTVQPTSVPDQAEPEQPDTATSSAQ